MTEGAGPTSEPGISGSGQAKLDTVILWCRRDLRVTDNTALTAALQLGRNVGWAQRENRAFFGTLKIPVYVWAPEEEGQFQPGRCSRWWLHQSLEAFAADLQALGSTLIYRHARESRTALVDLLHETGAQALVFNHLYDPISLVRDNEVKAAMRALNVHCQSFNADVLYEPWEVLAKNGQPFTCFEDFWNRMSSMEYPPPVPLPVPPSMPAVSEDIGSLGLKGLGLMTPEEEESNQQLYYAWTPGGKGAFQALETFVLDRLANFSNDRSKTDRSSTSRLSPHIHYGELSVRFIYYVVKQRELRDPTPQQTESCSHYLRQVAFREYGRYLSFHFPFTHERSLLEHLRAAPFKFNQRHFKAWRQGNTGYPMVDASMRELWSTGWLHNRSRVICASFLVKNLLLPWQWGLKHYWDALLDADLECDALGWQFCSGCLADAHPFEHMFNQVVEAKQYDPDGNYVRRWLPALARLPLKWIHKPWEAPEQVLLDAGIELGVNYPFPIISLADSQAHLKHAAAIIQDTVAASAAATHVPFRPASLPSTGQNPSSLPQNSRPLTPPGSQRITRPPGWKTWDEHVPGDLPGNMKEDEEVVSNVLDLPAPAISSANSPRQAAVPMDDNVGDGMSDEAAVVPSISDRDEQVSKAPARAHAAASMVGALEEEAVSRPRAAKRLHAA